MYFVICILTSFNYRIWVAASPTALRRPNTNCIELPTIPCNTAMIQTINYRQAQHINLEGEMGHALAQNYAGKNAFP